jgi:hypothetical protein
MEESIFPTPEVSKELDRFVEVRLHREVDPAVYKLQERLTGSSQFPNYLLIDPEQPENPLTIFGGSLLGGGDFLRWLRQN